MKSFAACLMAASVFAADSEMFHSRSPIYHKFTKKAVTSHAPTHSFSKSYGHGSYGHGYQSSQAHHAPAKTHYSGYGKSYHYGHKPQPTEKTPLDLLAERVAADRRQIEMNRNQIAILNSLESKQTYDYFFTNSFGSLGIRPDGNWQVVPPAAFCAEAGDTVKIFTNFHIDTNDSFSVVVIEIRKDGRRVAVSAHA